MMNKYNKIMVDCSNMYHRSYAVSQDMSIVDDKGVSLITGGIFTFVKMLKRIEKDFLEKDGEVFIVFDNTHSGENKRKVIDPEYKSSREKKDDGFYRGLDYLQILLLNYANNYKIVKRPGSEADDLISPLLNNLTKKEDKVLLISNDLDWFRSISENVHVAKYEKKDYNIYDIEKFQDIFGFYPTVSSICMYKAFRGDSSDNIPKGVSGIRENLLIEIINKFDNLKDLFSVLKDQDFLNANWKQKIRENKPRLLLNYKLVSFEEVPYNELKEYIFQCKFNPRTLKSIYNSLQFNIASFDPRVASFFPDKKKSGGFFEFDSVPRM